MTGIEEAQNLEILFGSVRDQGERPTCLAFAASDLHAGLRDGWKPLSCEFLYYHAQRRASRPPTLGATLSSTLDALRYDGQPSEEGWPYLTVIPAKIEQWQPPEDVGEVYYRAGCSRQEEMDELFTLLEAGRPLLILFYLSTSFYRVGKSGLVDPSAGEQPDFARRHAVVAVGHGVCQGERVVLVRNSWGCEWGRDGLAWLTEAFLQPRLFGLAVLKEKDDVEPPSYTE